MRKSLSCLRPCEIPLQSVPPAASSSNNFGRPSNTSTSTLTSPPAELSSDKGLTAASGSRTLTHALVHHGIHHSALVRASSPIFAVVWRLWRKWQALKAQLLENPTTKRQYKIVNRAALALPVLTGLLTGGGCGGRRSSRAAGLMDSSVFIFRDFAKISEEVLPLEISGSASVI